MPLYPQDANVGLSANIDRERPRLKEWDPSSRVLMDFLQADRELVGGLFLKSNCKGPSCMKSSFLFLSL